jgi:hypothetical protein
VDVGDFEALVFTDLGILATIVTVWTFVAKDGPSVRTRIGVLAAIGVIVLVVGLLAWPRSEADPTGQIISPASGESVARNVEVRGVLDHVPDDQHVWVIVRDGNLLYPQGSEVTPRDGPWSHKLRQGGTTKSISLELYRMTHEGDKFINDRLSAGEFGGISSIPGAKRLDVVENVRIRG